MRRPVLPLVVALTAALVAGVPQARAADGLQVGVGRADITSPTGYYMQGWVRSDAVLHGVNTRIEARAIVLKRGTRKLALVAEDLNGISGGVVKAAALRLAPLGYSESNLLVSASHTHAAPSGYYAYGTYNTVFMTKNDLTHQNVTGQLDPQLYAFEVRQLVLAVTRADRDLAPGELGWATTRLLGITANRSIEAHLADHGIHKAYGTGSVADDPLGYADTIDPDVQVLRVDRLTAGRYRAVGMWSTFADHGTVNKSTFGFYNADHHGSATRVVEQALRTLSGTPAGQDVVNAYGNTDEGDQSAGLTRSGPAAADAVGRAEAAAMLSAWRAAGTRLTSAPALDWRWTRVCFCGQVTQAGPVSSHAATGLPLFTGSEEGRGGLYDLTGIPFEGRASPVDDPVDPAQGHKIVVTRATPGSIPTAVPLLVAHIGERLVASLPGEMTVEMGRRVRTAIAAAAGGAVKAVQLSGLAGEYLSYFTTPEEYDAQHYEGGSTMYGRAASVFLQEQLVGLTRALTTGAPAPAADPTDPRNGVTDTAAPFGTGATSAVAVGQPTATRRLARATFAWTGGLRGLDMPLGRPFLTVERRAGSRWVRADDDLGLDLLWRVDGNGRYDAEWEVPRDAATGTYRFTVTANSYRLTSAAFPVAPSTALSVERLPSGPLRVRYPDAVVEVDLTARPAVADGGRLLRGTSSSVPAGGAVDAYGNCNGAAVSLAPGQRGGADAAADPAVCSPAVPARVAGPAPSGTAGGTASAALPATGAPPGLAVLGLLGGAGGLAARRLRGRRPGRHAEEHPAR